jgi:hypothetical protein
MTTIAGAKTLVLADKHVLGAAMSMRDSPYSLTPFQVQQALDVLDRARETFQLKPRTQRLYKFLRFAVYTAVSACIFGIVLLFAFVLVLALTGRVTKTDLNAAETSLAVGVLVAVTVTVVASLASLVLLLLNLPLVGRILRERATLRRLGLKDLSIVLWKAERKKSIWSRVWVGLVLAVGVLCLVSAGIVMFSRPAHGEVREVDAVVGAVVFLALGVTTVAHYFVQRGKEQLDLVADANQLRRWLLQLRQGAGGDQVIAVPAEALEKVARIESAQIDRQRAEAVAASVDARDRGYGILIARDVLAQKGALDPGRRLKVEELIERVGINPRSPEATADETQGLWRLGTADGEVEIVYGIDEPQRQVRLVATGPPQARSGVGGRAPGDSHA